MICAADRIWKVGTTVSPAKVRNPETGQWHYGMTVHVLAESSYEEWKAEPRNRDREPTMVPVAYYRISMD